MIEWNADLSAKILKCLVLCVDAKSSTLLHWAKIEYLYKHRESPMQIKDTREEYQDHGDARRQLDEIEYENEYTHYVPQLDMECSWL